MSSVKHGISNQKPVQAVHSRRPEDLLAKGLSDDLAMRRQLCNLLVALFTLGVVFAGVLIVLHGVGVLLLPTPVLITLVIVMLGAIPRMLGKIVKSAFGREGQGRRKGEARRHLTAAGVTDAE
jgi:hypothetical protein